MEADTYVDVASECADVVYFASVCLARANVPWRAVEASLDKKARRVRRRKGDAKPTTHKHHHSTSSGNTTSTTRTTTTFGSSSVLSDARPPYLPTARDVAMMTIGAVSVLGAWALLRNRAMR